MYATTKNSKLYSRLEIDNIAVVQPKLKAISSIQGRVVVLCLTTWYFGYTFTEMSPLSPTQVLQPQFGAFMGTENGNGPCFGLIPYGAALGVVLANLVIDSLSRRTFLVLLNLANLVVTGVLQTGDVYTLYIFRILQGVLVGFFMTLIPTYIGELTPKQYGSRFGVYPQISVVLGVLVAFTIGVIFTNVYNIDSGTVLSKSQYETFWRVQLAIPLIPSILQLFFIAIGYIPQSPHSLITKNRKEAAREVLCLFYEQSFVDQMVEDRESAIINAKSDMDENKVVWTDKGYMIGIILSVLQVLTGIASFVTQAGHVIAFTFKSTSIGLYTPILITISQLVGTFLSVPMLKYFQWRKMTIIGGFSLAFLDAMIGMLLYLYQQQDPANTDAKDKILLVTCIAIMFFMFTFGMSLGSSVWPYISFMMNGKGVVVASVVNWILAGSSIIAFSFVTNSMTSPYVMLFIYCSITFILTIVFTVMSVNVKGLSAKKVQMQLQ